MALNIFRITGMPVAPAVARDLLRLKAEHDKHCPCGVPMRVNSGYRTKSEQHRKFVAAYRRGARSTTTPPDYRWYQGSRWGRVGGPGVVQSPDVISNHTRGYAVDLNVTGGGVCQRWMLANAPRFGFNWIEGKDAREAWHWCWRIGLRPTASSPDPWDGRGAPDPVPATDPGMTLAQLLGPTPADNGSQPAGEGDDLFMDKINELWQTWMPGKKGVKTAGDAYLLFVEVVQKVRTAAAEAAKAVWATTVSRDGKQISALQEIADAKTLGLDANRKLDELLKRPASTVSLTDAQLDALAAKVGDKVALQLAPAVLDAMSKRLEE